MSPRLRRSLLLSLVALALLALVFRQLLPGGVEVVVHNRGSNSLPDLVIHVTGASYPIGDLDAGASVRLEVKPKSESPVRIEYAEGETARRSLAADCYFEAGYEGRVSITVENGAVVGAVDEARPMPSPPSGAGSE